MKRKENIDRFNSYKNVGISHPEYLVYLPLIRDLEYAVKKYAGKNVLDIGCGNKPYLEMFKGIADHYTGCDIVQSSLNKADIICEATKIPLPDSSFDTVFSTQVIEHVADHRALLQEAYRLLKPGGCIIVSGPMYWHLHEVPHDYFRFTKYGFKLILEESGFTVLEILANGGKWATLGQMVIHTFPAFLVQSKIFRSLNNRIFSYLDKNHYNDFNTMNYVIVGKKEITS